MGRECWTQNQEEVMLNSAAGLRMAGATVILLGSVMTAVVVQGVLHELVSRASVTGRGESADLARIRELSSQVSTCH